MGALHTIHIRGFRSIRDQKIDFGQLNVFIGGNGAGKSNLIGVFNFLRQAAKQRLQTYTGEMGGANSLLHFGRKHTDMISLSIEFRRDNDANMYEIDLNPTTDDRFIFGREQTFYWQTNRYATPYHDDYWTGHHEARIIESKRRVAGYVRDYLDSYLIYHFHDTSSSAAVKQTGDLADNSFLRPDAGNLSAYLYMLKTLHPDHYSNIEDTIRLVAPFFGRFRLKPSVLNPDKIRLEWEETDSDMYFNASALSDGTLRFICLATLLLQPDLPSLILIDEPELGLHPAAIQVLSALLKTASTRTQVIVSTQSVTLINQLLPEHVWVVDRENQQSVFRHLKEADMSSWLEDYSLGELWEKNILGGRP